MNILIPDSWLREYLKTNASPSQIKECLSLCGPSVERVTKEGDDVVYDIEITSNRVDMASVYGIAREAVVILPRFGFKATLSSLQTQKPVNPSSPLPMKVLDPDRICQRIMGIVMEVDTMKPSPESVKNRLEKSGVRSLNSLVDITNYVMLEVGHPCHVFDYDRIGTHVFIIRKAKKNEPIVTLDEKKYLLNEEDVIIDDNTGRVIDLPGIMGTQNSVVTKNTKRIFFFIESNNPSLIRKTSMRYGIRTMAATLNEKRPDPELVQIALFRGIKLYQEIAGGKILGDLIDLYPNPPKSSLINVTYHFINERLGVNLKQDEINSILRDLSFQIDSTDQKSVSVTPPSFRQFDINIAEDIVEEIARIWGYHNLPSKIMEGSIPLNRPSDNFILEEKAKYMLKYLGFTETYTYSFLSKELLTKAGLNPTTLLKIANPLTEETEYLRTSLIPSILEKVALNQSYKDNLSFFELAKVYLPKDKSLPQEPLSLLLTNQENFFTLKGIVTSLFNEFGIKEIDQEAYEDWNFGHPKQTLLFSISKNNKNTILAKIGALHPQLATNFNIKNKIYIAEINFQTLVEFYNPSKKYTPIPSFTSAFEDFTLTIFGETEIGKIIEEIYKVSLFIKNVKLKDVFQSTITLNLEYFNPNKNITKDEAKEIREKILENLKIKFKMELKK